MNNKYYQLSASFLCYNKHYDYVPNIYIYTSEEKAMEHKEEFIQRLKNIFSGAEYIEIFCDELYVKE